MLDELENALLPQGIHLRGHKAQPGEDLVGVLAEARWRLA